MTKEETQITYIEYDDIVNDEIMKTDFYVVFTKNIIKLLSEQVNAKNTRNGRFIFTDIIARTADNL